MSKAVTITIIFITFDFIQFLPFKDVSHISQGFIVLKKPLTKVNGFFMEQGTGVEPAFTAWEAVVLPIYEPCT